MIKNIAKLCAVASLFACGSASEDGLFEPSQEVADAGAGLGSVELGLASKNSPTFQGGVSTANSRAACTKTSTGQVCTVPTIKQFFYCLGGGFSASQKTRARNVAARLDAVLSNFVFSEVTLAHPSCIVTVLGEPTPALTFIAGTCSGTTATDNIEAYSCGSFVTANGNLTEGAGVVGNYKSHSGYNAVIDLTDIFARGANVTEDSFILDQGFARGFLSFMGNGTRNVNSFSTRTVRPAGVLVDLSPGDICRLESYAVNNQSNFGIATPQCLTD